MQSRNEKSCQMAAAYSVQYFMARVISAIFDLQSTMEDYEDMPVTSYGAAMLRGMGWKKGEAIGGTNKG